MTLPWGWPRALPIPPPLALTAEGVSAPFLVFAKGSGCVGRDSPRPPSHRGWDRAFGLSGNGASKDYTIQLQPPSLLPLPIPASFPVFLPQGPLWQQMPMGMCQPQSAPLVPLLCSGCDAGVP